MYHNKKIINLLKYWQDRFRGYRPVMFDEDIYDACSDDFISLPPFHLGLFKHCLGDYYELTPAGQALLTSKRKEEVFLRQMLKFQVPSPYHQPTAKAASFGVKPYLEILRLVRTMGTLKFDADINFKGIEYSDMMNSMKGNAEFEIVNGVLANLGSLKMILGAQNIISNSVLKNTAQNITALPAVQSASEFDYIKGNLRFDKGYAILEPVVTSGPSMAYYITGRFHLLNGTVNAIVLGRLSEDVASILGSISDFAVDTITSLIPGLESVTTKLAKTMTISPDKVDTSKIPALGNNETEYKDFRVEFNGGVDSQSSVKTFKWVANADTQELEKSQTQKQLIEAQNAAKEQLNLIKEGVKEDAKVIEQSAKEFYNQNKEQINKLKDDANDLFKSLFQTPSSTPDTESLN